jgi:hypothetical protein
MLNLKNKITVRKCLERNSCYVRDETEAPDKAGRFSHSEKIAIKFVYSPAAETAGRNYYNLFTISYLYPVIKDVFFDNQLIEQNFFRLILIYDMAFSKY